MKSKRETSRMPMAQLANLINRSQKKSSGHKLGLPNDSCEFMEMPADEFQSPAEKHRTFNDTRLVRSVIKPLAKSKSDHRMQLNISNRLG